jgi:hypothetical protein
LVIGATVLLPSIRTEPDMALDEEDPPFALSAFFSQLAKRNMVEKPKHVNMPVARQFIRTWGRLLNDFLRFFTVVFSNFIFIACGLHSAGGKIAGGGMGIIVAARRILV